MGYPELSHLLHRTRSGIRRGQSVRPRRSDRQHGKGRIYGRQDTRQPRRQHQIRAADDRREKLRVPGLRGHDRAGRHRHLEALRAGRRLHLRPGLHLDGKLRVQDHLYRRRRRHPALSRLSDRAARRERRLPRDLLPPALRRTADQGAEAGLRLSREPSHDGPRADEPLLPGLPPRRAPDGGDVRLGRRAVGVLSRLRPTSPIRRSA